jgi:hypothetical protein
MRTTNLTMPIIATLAASVVLAQTSPPPGPTRPEPDSSPLSKPGTDMDQSHSRGMPRRLEPEPEVDAGAVRDLLREDEGGQIGANLARQCYSQLFAAANRVLRLGEVSHLSSDFLRRGVQFDSIRNTHDHICRDRNNQRTNR